MKKEVGGANLCRLSRVKMEWAAFKTVHSFLSTISRFPFMLFYSTLSIG